MPAPLDCRLCHLWTSRHQVVNHRGTLGAPVLFVGEAPGREEDRFGIPFVGRAGREVLDPAIQFCGLPPSQYCIVNVVRCRPTANGRNRPPAEEEADTCGQYLEFEMQASPPKLLVLLGATAHKWWRSMDWRNPRLSVAVGTVHRMPHPASTFYVPDLTAWNDAVATLRLLVDRTFAAIRASAIHHKTLEEFA